MSLLSRHLVGVAAFSLVISCSQSLWAVAPNPLQSAYWRFDEQGAASGTPVAGGTNDTVLDSINQNHLKADSAGSAPTYTSSVAPTQLKSGLTNNLALNFQTDDDLYTVNAADADGGKKINNGIIGGTERPDITGFTIEAAFRASSVVHPNGAYQAIIAKEGRPVTSSPLETLELKIRGDTGVLQIEQFDKSGTVRQVSTSNALNANQWYYVAAVNDGSSLTMYLDSNDGNGYKVKGSTPVSGAIWQGTSDDWSKSWTIGRGRYGVDPDNKPTDWFSGVIDEVRISNSPLLPWQFLFAPQGDYNGDKLVDAADYAVWRKTNNVGDLGYQEGYQAWRSHFGEDYSAPALSSGESSVPEPASVLIAASALCGVTAVRRSNRRRGSAGQ